MKIPYMKASPCQYCRKNKTGCGEPCDRWLWWFRLHWRKLQHFYIGRPMPKTGKELRWK